jgi:membrane-bound ClpP family serine protease
MEFTPVQVGFTVLVHLPFLLNTYQQVAQDWRTRFRKWSMPRWFPFLLVPLQLGLNVLLWLPGYRVLGAIGLGVILLAAIMTLTRYYEKRAAYYLPIAGMAALTLWGFFAV